MIQITVIVLAYMKQFRLHLHHVAILDDNGKIILLSRSISKNVNAGNGSENCCQQYRNSIHSIVVKKVKT